MELAPILIVFTGIISLSVIAAGYYVITPVFLNIQENPNPACVANTKCTVIFDRMHDLWFIIFEMAVAGMFLAMYMRAARKERIESSFDGGFSSGDNF